MKTLRLTLETVTPLFLGGSDSRRGNPELRPASFKGALRFWWRALWGGAHPEQSVKKLSDVESKIFGSTEGASPIILRLSNSPNRVASWKFKQRAGVDYLFFSLQGRREPDRKGFSAGQQFEFTLQTRLGLDQKAENDVFIQACAALWLLVMLGGVGARSRRGAGNLGVVTVQEGWPEELPPLPIQTTSAANFAREISGGLRKIYQAMGWHSPGNASRIPEHDILHPEYGPIYVLKKEWNSWESALNEVGNAYQIFRSRRDPDYQNVKDAVSGRSSSMPPVERAGFGLPIVFYYRSLGGQRGTLEGKGSDRRASPLLFHISKLASGKYVVSFTWFKAQLLPRGSGLKLKRRGKPVFANSPSDKSIVEFLQAIGVPDHVDKHGQLSIAPLYQVHYPKKEETV